ncbi:cardiolipin synthase [Fulvimarina pelagi HTCC2506]|uniref:Cardiolipin synthase n=1 Tax=Fulvimarina pelagi HTCC2506 TaxID=314231 RepID=Q0G2A6_9HYPH|nr:cardiolipin synthase [Fulvimarina pelagi]EAU41292.1 cardiolipin synthase [Fulvimarina pelagi HTCC2506]
MFDASSLALYYLLCEWAIRLVMIVVIPMSRPPEAARTWLLLVLFLPIPALLAYRLLGRARFPSWRRKRFAATEPMRAMVADSLAKEESRPASIARLAERLGGFPVCGGNRIGFLTDYEAAVDALVNEIDKAVTTVHLLTYIFADDRTGQKVAEALARARNRGVEVRVMLDALGSRAWTKRTIAMLEFRSIEARLILPVRLAALHRARGDLRNHRKLCIIDGSVGFVGSQNIVDRDFRPGIVNDELVARVEGPVVSALEAVFSSDWYLETRQELAPIQIPKTQGEAALQAMPSGPDFDTPGFERLLVELVHDARERLVIVSPYLIPDEALLVALKNAVARGVSVDLIVSRIADQRLVSLAQRSYYDELMSAGIALHRYRDRLLHAKNVSIDGRVGVIGSSNADVRSFTLNAEISLILHDASANATLERIQSGYIAGSDRLGLTEWRARRRRERLLENMARLVGPLL